MGVRQFQILQILTPEEPKQLTIILSHSILGWIVTQQKLMDRPSNFLTKHLGMYTSKQTTKKVDIVGSRKLVPGSSGYNTREQQRIQRVTLKGRHRTIVKQGKRGAMSQMRQERDYRKASSEEKKNHRFELIQVIKLGTKRGKKKRKIYKKGKVFMLYALNQLRRIISLAQ